MSMEPRTTWHHCSPRTATFILLLLLATIVIFAVTGCGETRWDREEEAYVKCMDSGGEWVQIGEGHYVCENQREGNEE